MTMTQRQRAAAAAAAAEAIRLEEMKAAKEMEAMKKREGAKKKRLEEKKAEEEAEKAKARDEAASRKHADAAVRTTADEEVAAQVDNASMEPVDIPSEAAAAGIDGVGVNTNGGLETSVDTPVSKVDTNAHINEMNGGRGTEGDPLMLSSPVRKKRKKSKRKDKKDKGEIEEPPSILKKGKVEVLMAKKKLHLEETLKTAVEKRKDVYDKYVHNHGRVIITASLVCGQVGTQAKMNEFIMGARALYKNLLKVDKTVVLEPEREGVDERVYDPTQIPLDLTEAGAWIRPSGDAGVFDMRKPRKNDANKKKKVGRIDEVEDEDAGKVDPEVWTQLCISCDEDPEDLLERCSYEWRKIGGVRLQVKEIAAFSTKSAATFYFMNSGANLGRVKEEVKRIIVDAIQIGIDQVDEFYSRGVPDFALKLATPRIEGQNTQVFRDWSWSKQNMRKTIHVDVETANVPYMHDIIRIAKDFGLVTKYFGRGVKAAIVVEKSKKGRKGDGEVDMSKYDLAAVAAWSRDHINYQANTMYDGIRGILNVDQEVEVQSVANAEEAVGKVSLRTLLYKKVKMGEYPLFLEIHQGAPMMPVDVVVGNCEEAERMMLMINKNPAAFFFYYLRDVAKVDAGFLKVLLEKTMDPTLVKDIDKCKWDAVAKVLTSPQDEENERMAVIEKAAWYKDEFGGSLFEMGGKEKKEFSTREQLEDLYKEDQSFHTVTKKKGTPAKGKGQGVGFADGTVGKMSAGGHEGGTEDLSMLTKEQLIERLMRNADITSNSGSQPSRTSSAAGEVHSIDGDESGSSSGSYSSGSSENSSESLPSGGGKTVRLSSAHSE